MKKAARRPLFFDAQAQSIRYAAFSHIAVSNALLISGMFMPKFAPAVLFAAALTGFSVMLCATSVARSQELCS